MKKTLKLALALGLITVVTTAIALIVEELREDTLKDFEPTLDEDDDGIDGDCFAKEEDTEDCYYTKGEAITPADSEDNSTSTGEEE